jgi:hypothetical protein
MGFFYPLWEFFGPEIGEMKRRSGQRGNLIRASYRMDNLAVKTRADRSDML